MGSFLISLMVLTEAPIHNYFLGARNYNPVHIAQDHCLSASTTCESCLVDAGLRTTQAHFFNSIPFSYQYEIRYNAAIILRSTKNP